MDVEMGRKPVILISFNNTRNWLTAYPTTLRRSACVFHTTIVGKKKFETVPSKLPPQSRRGPDQAKVLPPPSKLFANHQYQSQKSRIDRANVGGVHIDRLFLGQSLSEDFDSSRNVGFDSTTG